MTMMVDMSHEAKGILIVFTAALHQLGGEVELTPYEIVKVLEGRVQIEKADLENGNTAYRTTEIPMFGKN